MIKKRKLRFFKFVASYFLEKHHRYLFDNIYVQAKRASVKQKMFCKAFNIFVSYAPDFRQYLKHNKPILKRAYHQRRCSLRNHLLVILSNKVNTGRYSNYF